MSLVPELPIAGAVHVYFADMPAIEWDFTGIGNVVEFPGIRQLIRRIVCEQLSALLVLPNRLTVRLMDDSSGLDMFYRSYQKPLLLRLTVLEATGLKNTDQRFLVPDKSDPYAVVRVGSKQVTTATIKNDLNPKWNETHEFLVHSVEQSVRIEVYDDDFGGDDHLGTAVFSLLGIADTIPQEFTASLGVGTIRIRAETFGLHVDSRPEVPESGGTSAVLVVLVDQAFGLPTDSCKSATVQAFFGDCAVSTTSIPLMQVPPAAEAGAAVPVANPNPEWEQALEFLCVDSDLSSADVQLTVLDDKGKSLGVVTYPLGPLLDMEGMGADEVLELSDAAADGMRLKVRVQLYAMHPVSQSELPGAGDVTVPFEVTFANGTCTNVVKVEGRTMHFDNGDQWTWYEDDAPRSSPVCGTWVGPDTGYNRVDVTAYRIVGPDNGYPPTTLSFLHITTELHDC